MYRKIAFRRIVLPGCAASNASTETIHSPTPKRTDLRRKRKAALGRNWRFTRLRVIEIVQAIRLEELWRGTHALIGKTDVVARDQFPVI
jgi:hypothetical protein